MPERSALPRQTAVPWRCRVFGHRVDIRVANISGHQSYRAGFCVRCGGQFWQRTGYFGPSGDPWREGSGSSYGDEGKPVKVQKAGCL